MERADRDASERVIRDYRDGADDPTSVRIVLCVAAACGVSPTALPPLGEAVDPDAVDALFPRDGSGNCSLSFSYAGAPVYLSSDCDIRVTDDV